MKEFFRKWKKGMNELSPIQLTKAKMVGHGGTIAGTALGWGFLFISGLGYWSVLLFFIIFLQVINLIETKKQYDNMQKFIMVGGKDEKKRTRSKD